MAGRGSRPLAVPMETAVRLHADSHGNPEDTVPRARQAGPRGPPPAPSPLPTALARAPTVWRGLWGKGWGSPGTPAHHPWAGGRADEGQDNWGSAGCPPSHDPSPARIRSHRLGDSSTYCVPAGAHAAGRPRKPLPQEAQGGSRAGSQRRWGRGAGLELRGLEEEGGEGAGEGWMASSEEEKPSGGRGAGRMSVSRGGLPAPPSTPPEASWCWRPGPGPPPGPWKVPVLPSANARAGSRLTRSPGCPRAP